MEDIEITSNKKLNAYLNILGRRQRSRHYTCRILNQSLFVCSYSCQKTRKRIDESCEVLSSKIPWIMMGKMECLFSRSARTSNLKILRCCLADYGNEMYLNAGCTCSTILFPPSTNHIIDLWLCRCRCCRRFLNLLLWQEKRELPRLVAKLYPDHSEDCFSGSFPNTTSFSSIQS